MEIQMLKAKNVRKPFLLILFGLLPSHLISQTKFEGTFCVEFATKDISNCLRFESDQIFKYKLTGDTGTFEYGIGEYKFIDNYLVLNYNKTKPLKIGHHNSEIWLNKFDSIEVHLVLLDFNNNPISNVNVLYKDNLLKNGYKGVISDNKGEAIINLKKGKEDLELTCSHFNYRAYKISIDKNFNYKITVF